ncbi:MAG: serine/threonine protein kinase, partial [Acidobacteria bacterium]|nr:serine/threonine protein kinase [Acidobacteriota bacterium]
MSSEQKRKLLNIYSAAMDLEGEARSEYLTQVERDEPDIAAEVKAMVEAAESESGFMSDPLFDLVPDEVDLEKGTIIGHFEILDSKKAGSGGEAVVYKARDQNLPRDVAIKLPKLRYTDPARQLEFNRRTRAEAETLAGLHHENIVSIYEAGDFNGLSYFAMEYVEGTVVKDLVDTKLAPERVLRIALGVANGLSYAHERGISHLDIKPENIVVDSNDNARILDFGIAKVRTDLKATTCSGGEVRGTIAYMSPEQLRKQHDKIDHRSDIWSLGVVVYEMLTGRRPFSGTNVADEVAKIFSGASPGVSHSKMRSDVSVLLNRLLAKALNPNPTERFSTAADMIAALEDVKARHAASSAAAAAAEGEDEYMETDEFTTVRLPMTKEAFLQLSEEFSPELPA